MTPDYLLELLGSSELDKMLMWYTTLYFNKQAKRLNMVLTENASWSMTCSWTKFHIFFCINYSVAWFKFLVVFILKCTVFWLLVPSGYWSPTSNDKDLLKIDINASSQNAWTQVVIMQTWWSTWDLVIIFNYDYWFLKKSSVLSNRSNGIIATCRSNMHLVTRHD